MEQRAAIKFCVKLEKSATETFAMSEKAFGDECLLRARIFEWYKRFKTDRESLKDDEQSGRPSTSRTQESADKIQP